MAAIRPTDRDSVGALYLLQRTIHQFRDVHSVIETIANVVQLRSCQRERMERTGSIWIGYVDPTVHGHGFQCQRTLRFIRRATANASTNVDPICDQ